MKNRKKSNIYWDKQVEIDIRTYIKNYKEWPKLKKDRFFTQKLYHKFYLLSENILKTYNNRYGLSRIEDSFQNLIYNCVSEIYTKLDYFDINRDTKAFSYFGTVVKNYLIQQAIRVSTLNNVLFTTYESVNSMIFPSPTIYLLT